MTTDSPTSAVPLAIFASRLAHFGSIATLVAAPLVMSTMTARSFEAVKTAALVPLALLMVPGVLLAADRGVIRRALAAAPGAYLAMALLLIGLAASTLLSETPWTAFFGSYYRRDGLVAWLACGILFWYLATAEGAPDTRLLLRLAAALSIAPCAYALLQRFGHDFFTTGMIDPGGPRARPGGTLGNPIYLGAYLVMLIPVTLYCALSEKARFARTAWLGILALQVAAITLSLSRGPQLGLAFALAFMGITATAGSRPRLLLSILAVVLAGAAGLGVLAWIFPGAREWLLGVPLFERWFVSEALDTSRLVRVAIWRIGFDTLIDAPALRIAAGYGPDAAHFAYYPHIPSFLSSLGPLDTIDRLHNEPLDLAASCGVPAALAFVAAVALLVFHAARHLFGLSGSRHALAFAGVSALAGLGFAALAVLVLGRVEWAPAGFGLGLALGWMAFFAWHAGRVRMALTPGADGAQRRLLIIALTAAIVGYWVDSQVGVPTGATRTVCFAAAALLLRSFYEAEPAARPQVLRPCISATLACAALVAAALLVSSFFPAEFGAKIESPTASGLWAKLVVLGSLACAGLAVFGAELRALAGTRTLALSFAAASTFAVAYSTASWLIAHATDADIDVRLAALPGLGIAAACACCIALALRGGAPGGDALAPLARRKTVQLAVIVAGAFLLAAAAAWDSRELRADILAKIAAWAYANGRAEQALTFLDRSATLLPAEKQYRLASGTRELEQVVKRLGSTLDLSELPALDARLVHAEHNLRAALASAPSDPWTILAVANVLQVRALSGLRAWVGAERGERAAAEARTLFGRAQAAYPAQPLIARNWAQFEFDQGDTKRGFELLDVYEALNPRVTAPYVERVKYAAAVGNTSQIEAMLQRADRFLQPEDAQAVRNFAAQYRP